ncbi:MAG: family 78 glycoside hydrolase catalytic domain, partial [Bacteroidales bacterium]|nr:family 78 glycoside hydrolase catalytic domain [Bacteroidales bacterium]
MAIVLCFISCGPSFEVYDLRCEGLSEPLGIDSPEPHFSWKITSREPMAQVAYEIQVAGSLSALKSGKADLWSSGRVASSDQVMVPYSGIPLASRKQCWWRVRVWKTEDDVSAWSSPERFGIGIVGEDSLSGEYLGATLLKGDAPLVRKSFTVADLPSQALLYVNSLGYHEAYINGKPVSDAVLTPAVSQLDKRSLIVTYDVTRLLRKGDNEIVFWLGSGWYKPLTFRAAYPGPLVRAELDALTPEGPVSLVRTDRTWKGASSGYSDYESWGAGHFGGEVINASEVPGSLEPESLDKLSWRDVEVVKIDGIEASQQMCEPCRVLEVVPAKSVTPAGKNRWVVDFGRVMNGMLEIRLPSMDKGHKTEAGFCDAKVEDGFSPVSRDYYLSSGAPGGDLFKDKFNHHVFRYVVLENLPQAPRPEDIKGLRMRTDYKMGGSFESSDQDMNAIHDMVRYTLENLAFDGYMVDCANIERLGYGGDGNASTLTLQILSEVSPLYVNWLQAWNDCVHEDGGLPHTAPCPYRAGGGPYWCGFIVQAPWRTWMSYADPRLLERCYPTMLRWLEYVDTYTVDGLLKRWPDEPYRAWYLGDWAAPEGVETGDLESVDLVNNCSLCQVYRELEAIAAVVGHPEDAAGFRARYEALG